MYECVCARAIIGIGYVCAIIWVELWLIGIWCVRAIIGGLYVHV